MKTPGQCVEVYTHVKACTSRNTVSADAHAHGHSHMYRSAYNSWIHTCPCAHTKTHINTHIHIHSSTQSDLGKSSRTLSHRMTILSADRAVCVRAHTRLPFMPRPWTGLGEVGL